MTMVRELLLAACRTWAIRREVVMHLAGLMPVEASTDDGMGPASLAPALASLVEQDTGPASLEGQQTEPAAEARAARNAVAGGVAVIPVRGVIRPSGGILEALFGGGSRGLRGLRADLLAAVKSDEVSTIVLDIDSPGGLTDLVPETAADIRAARESKRVIAVANTMAASAAYWLASQADEIVVTPSGEVGSIGVYAMHLDISRMDERLGLKTTLISAGRYKTEGNPYEPLSETARAAIQETVNDFYALFVEDVARGRRVATDRVRSGFGEGRVLTAQRAVAAGLADRVATLDETVQQLVGGARSRRKSAATGAHEKEGLLAQIREQLDQSTKTLQEVTDA